MSANNGFFGTHPFSGTNQLLQRQNAEPVDWRLP
jgi:uracil-DNA glycosylase